MTGWIVAGGFYVLGVVIVWRGAEDPMHRMMAPIWPFTVLYLLLTIRK